MLAATFWADNLEEKLKKMQWLEICREWALFMFVENALAQADFLTWQM